MFSVLRLVQLTLQIAVLAGFSNGNGHDTPPISLEMQWFLNDPNGGFYISNISVGTPPQQQMVILDTGYSDISLHYPKDTLFQNACQSQTPIPLCVAFDNDTSSTYHGFGNGTYIHTHDQPFDFGEYISDTLMLGPLSIKRQTMAFATSSAFAFAELGTGPPNQQDGRRTGTFPQYSSFSENLVAQGVYDSASYSVWLDPSLGPDNDVNAMPPGLFTLGGLDSSLFEGSFTTLPTVADNSTTVVSIPEHWNLALSALTLGKSATNLVANTVSCTIHTGANVLFIPSDTFKNLIAQFPQAVLNATTGVYQVPCSERSNAQNSLSFTFADPRYLGSAASSTEKHQFSFSIPAAETIWTADRLAPGGDPRTCGVAAFPIDVIPGNICSLGISMMKSGLWVYDLTNAEISFAPAVPRGRKRGGLVRIPKGGVKELSW